MKIQNNNRYYDIMDKTKDSYRKNEEVPKISDGLQGNKDIRVTISEEGKNKLYTESLRKEKDNFEEKVFTIENTNEVFFEHYSNMVKITGEKLKQISDEREYGIEDVMKETMDAYEKCYQDIIEKHKNGDRTVVYDIAGESNVTLDEDLKGLDEAFEKRIDDLSGFISIKQLNKKFANPDSAWWFERMGIPHSKKAGTDTDYNEEYEEQFLSSMLEIMRTAQKNFLDSYNGFGYRKGMATNILMDLMLENNKGNNVK